MLSPGLPGGNTLLQRVRWRRYIALGVQEKVEGVLSRWLEVLHPSKDAPQFIMSLRWGMLLYKYLEPSRLDVLEHRRIRFTQPGDFNDPFEFRPCIQAAAPSEEVQSYVDKHFEQLVEENLNKYGALVDAIPKSVLKGLLVAQKDKLPDLFRLLEPQVIQKASSFFDTVLNQNVGVLCLSEIRDSILMWGHYTDNHKGVVVGFDSDHVFFSRRRSENDEFGFLRQVIYQVQRPRVILSDTTSTAWFETKSEQWAYEKEWRIVRVLSEAACRIDRNPFSICLFEFPADAVREIIMGIRFPSSLLPKVQTLAATFPGAVLLRAFEDPHDYRLVIHEVP
jgi:hypothetical protein